MSLSANPKKEGNGCDKGKDASENINITYHVDFNYKDVDGKNRLILVILMIQEI